MDALGDGVGVGVGVGVGFGVGFAVRVGFGLADGVPFPVVGVVRVVRVAAADALGWCVAVEVACGFALLTADGAVAGRWSGFAGLLAVTADRVGVGVPVALGDSAPLAAGRTLAAAEAPEPDSATAMTPVATAAEAVVAAVRASTNRTARSRRRPEG